MIELVFVVGALTFALLNNWRSRRKVKALQREVDSLQSRPRPEDVIVRVDAVDEDGYSFSYDDSGQFYGEAIPDDWPYRTRSESEFAEWCHFHQRIHGGWVCVGPKE